MSTSAASYRALYRSLLREIRRSAIPRVPLSPRTDPLQTYVHSVFSRDAHEEDVLHLAASPVPVGTSSATPAAPQAAEATGSGDAFATKGWKAARGWEEGEGGAAAAAASQVNIGIQETEEGSERLRDQDGDAGWRAGGDQRVSKWRVDMEDLRTYLLARRRHLELLARYNPTHDQTEQERVRATVNRVGLEIPKEYVMEGEQPAAAPAAKRGGGS